MKPINALLIIVTLSACQSKQAVHLQNVIDSADRNVFQVLNADSIEGARLRASIAKQPHLALDLGSKQVHSLNEILTSIDKIDSQNMVEADSYKEQTLNYYKALLRFKKLDTLESNLMIIMSGDDTSAVRRAGEQFNSLLRKRVEAHMIIGNIEHEKSIAKAKFQEANGLKE